ncbi:MAG: hypothetical protein E6J13_15445 [Chloroflexi bacterium]|nr:MAG: hypothetical protein E6J13_15445 [Chloroflexota bacterium]
MGHEARCTARFRDAVSEGKALLETDGIEFRGDDGLRLKLPFKGIRSVEALDGQLRVESQDGPAIFELGADAHNWAEKILQPKSLLDKLGVKAGMEVAVIGVGDPAFLSDLRARTENVSSEQPTSAVDMIPALKQVIRPDGAVWVVFRKGRKDFNENDILRGGLAAGLVDVKVVRFSETHTASKFVVRKAERNPAR